MNTIYVSETGQSPKGPCPATVQEALDLAAANYTDEPVTILIQPGVYMEKLVVSQPYLTLEGAGQTPEEVVIRYADGAKEILEDGIKRGTFRTATFRTDTHDFTARNLTFENACGPGKQAGQGLALYADGDKLFFDNCRFLGWQDTIFTAPLPLQEREPGGFRGPKEFAPRINGRHYFRNCFVQGEVDFIFGSATAYFEGCEFFSLNIGQEINGYVTAASTPEGQTYGYVMDHCRFTSNCPDHSVYIGRPWRPFAKTVLLNCELGPHIVPAGWADWWTEPHDNVYFAEYHSFGDGADMVSRPEWTFTLSEEEARNYRKELVLEGWDPLT